MSKLFDRRDFLLHVAPLIAAPALILGSVEEMEAQIKNFALRTPTNNTQVSVGQTVQISLALIRTAYPRISRIDFKANNQIIGTSSTRPYQMNWQPTQAGNFALTAEAVLSNGGVITTSVVNIIVATSQQLTVLHDGILSAPNWGSIGRGGYICIANSVGGVNAPTCWEGTLTSPKTLRKLELITQAYYQPSDGNFVPLDMSGFGGAAFPIFFRIWNENIQTFCSSPFAGFGTIGIPNAGSTTVPIITEIFQNQVFGIHLIGWDNLNFPMPANAPLKMSVQFETFDPNRRGQSVTLFGSRVPGPHVTHSEIYQGTTCYFIAEPSMASRITVSD